MIKTLEHSSKKVATEIHAVFRLSYKIEAQLVGVEDFPPLFRTVEHIQSAISRFIGLWIDSELAAVTEYTHNETHLSIDSLAVHPSFFRRGLASQLVQFLLDSVDWRSADVETAVANNPAITLYEKFGFSEVRRWKTTEGIDKIQLTHERL